MSEVIDLSSERNRRNTPNPEHVRHDEYGSPLYEFLFDYEMGGGFYSFSLFAYDWEDAERRAAAISAGVTVAGQLHAVDPA
jgi:hypothetical protein